MKKKLLAGIMALALCSTSIPQMIFAEEFTSEALEETEPEETGETPEVFTDENPATTNDTIGGASTFSSEEIPEFDDEEGNVSAATDGGSTAGTSPIDINNHNNLVYTISTSGSYRFTGTGTETSNRIVIDNVTSGEVKIYLNNVNINTNAGPALKITSTVTAQVCIYLEGQNILKTTQDSSAALQKDNNSGLTITSTNTVTGSLAAQASYGAGIGSGQHIGYTSISGYTVSNITISNCSIEASSDYGAGIGSGHHMGGNSASISGNTVSNITISNCSIKASSNYGAGIGSGYCVGGAYVSISGNIVSDITISNSSIEASSSYGAGIGSGYCERSNSASISGNTVSNITISGGSVKATKIDCIPKDSKNNDVYLCKISNAASSEITIDAVKRNGPYNHSSIDPSDTTLYAWLTGTDHVVTVGNDSRKYSFDSANYSFTRSKVAPTASQFTFTPPSNLTYDGQQKSVTVRPKSDIEGMGSNITVNYFPKNKLINGLPVNAGTYTVKIDIDEGAFYNSITGLTDNNWNFTIEPAPISTSAIQITPYSGTYDGAPHAAISSVTGCPYGCTIKYSIDGINWKDDCPTVESVADAANTSVYIQISKENYTTWTSGPQNATISPKGISDSDIQITPYSGIYDGSHHKVISSVTGCPYGCTIKYSIDGINWKDDCPTVKSVADAANTSVYIQISKENYTPWTSKPQNATISPKGISDSDIQITPYSGTYDGAPHAAISSVTGCPDGCTIKYSIDGTNWKDDCPTVESVADAANTSVYIQISKENYTTWTSGPQNATISPKGISDSDIQITPYSGIYDGSHHKVISSVTGCPDGCTIKYSIDGTNWKDDCPTVKSVADAANTSVYIQISKENYTPWTSKPQNATISPKGISDSDIQITPYSGIYDGSHHKVISSVTGCPYGCTIKYSIDGINWKDDCPTVESVADAANTSVYIQISKENYTTWTSGSQNATISPKGISDSDIQIAPYSGTYDGNPHAAISSVKGCPDGCTIKYSIDGKNWKDDCPTVESVADAANTSVYIQISKKNYTTWTSSPQKANISPKNITINIDNLEKTYGTDNPTLTFTVPDSENQLVTGDTIDSLGIKLTTTAGTSSPVNSNGYPITLESCANNNYKIIKAENGTLRINPATFDENSIEITAYNRIYDGDEHPIITGIFPTGSNVEYSTESPNETTIWSSTCPNVKTVADAQKTNVWIKISKDNYATKIYGPIQATINPASEAPGYPSTAKISVPWSCKKVNEIATNLLPANWKWQTEDAAKDLQVGNNSAAAIYTGEDKGNYVSETVTYTIIRSKCEHKHTAERYYSSPSCTSSGYSGDTYCKDCNETISYGYTISAYGHDYDNGVITTEPTAETDGIITYTCKRCKHQDTKTLGKLGDGGPYIEGSFQKKGWDAVNDLIKVSKEKDTISITLNGSRTLPASVLSGIKGKDFSLNLDMENGFIWKINGTSITAETPADIDLSVTNTAEYIPAALYSLISTNQNDFGFHLGRNGAFDFPSVLSVKADASCAGLMANLFWYDVENGVLQCIQTVTVGGAFERSIPYADFTLSKGQDYFIAFGTESLNGRVIHTDGSITDEKGAYLRPANTKISSHSIDRNKLTVKLSKGCAGAQGYDFVISKKSNMLQTGKFSKKVSSTGKPQASFRYLAKGTWYVAARSWVLDEQGNKVYGSWTKIKKIKITVVTPQQPKIKDITVKENTVTVTYTKCKNATGYEILLGNKYKTSAGEKYPVKKYVKRTEGKNTVTVTFTIVKKGTWYVTVRSWNKTSKNKSRVYSPYSDIKKFKVKK